LSGESFAAIVARSDASSVGRSKATCLLEQSRL
jgi:hypothetical protein